MSEKTNMAATQKVGKALETYFYAILHEAIAMGKRQHWRYPK